MRVFVALEMPQRTKDNLQRSSMQFQDFAQEGNFVKPQNFHLTLHFLGDVAPNNLIFIQSAMDKIRQLPAPELAILQFIIMKTSNVLCAKLKKNDNLLQLHEQLGKHLENNGFTVEHRAYRPHITLARKAKFTLPFTEVTKSVDVFNAPFVANKVVLYESTLTKEGPIYNELYSVTLQ